MIWQYYEHAADLRDRLTAAGHDVWAGELLAAERAAGTSGEAISGMTTVLRQIPAGVDGTLRVAVDALIAEGERIWADANG